MTLPITINNAVPEDAMAMADIHHAAIHAAANGCYPKEVIKNWAGTNLEESANYILSSIRDTGVEVILARRGDELAGYGMVSLARNYLGAVFVKPSMMGKKIGAQILDKLETAARNQGLAYLELDASLNAEGFYLKNGYESIGKGIHKLRSGASMACVKMKIIL